MRINVQNVEILIKIIFKKVQVYIFFGWIGSSISWLNIRWYLS